MAHILEEEFASKHTPSPYKRVLELGPGNFCWALNNKYNKFVGIDLFNIDIHASSIPDDLKNSHIYKVGNILHYNEEKDFDATVALSSFEHVGMEFPYIEIGKPDYDEALEVAKKLIDLTKVGGKIIITTPGGDDLLYGVPKREGANHEVFSHGKDNPLDYKYIFRSYNPSSINTLFEHLATIRSGYQLRLVEQIAYRFNGTPAEFFEKDKWSDLKLEHVKAGDYVSRMALLCTAYERVK